MQVITAPETIDITEQKHLHTLFLAGGIQKCPEWQKEVINGLKDMPVTIYNPRRENFPIHDPNAAEEQITWEFNAIEKCSIFSMWFCDSDSDQPICMYELGRRLAKANWLSESCFKNITCIGVHPKYKRAQDVYIQTKLALQGRNFNISSSLENHIEEIKKCVNFLNKNSDCIITPDGYYNYKANPILE